MKSLKLYAKEIARNNKEQNASYLHSLLLSIVMLILFMHMTTNDYYKINYITGGNGSGIIVAALGTTGMMYTLIMIYRANLLFLDQHQRMLGIMNLSGLKIFQSFRYISGISITVFKKAILWSILITAVSLPILNSISNIFLDNINVFMYDVSAYMYSLLALVMLWFFLMLQNVGFIYRIDIKKLLSKTRAKEEAIIEFPLGRSFAIVIFIIPLFLLLYYRPSDFYSIVKFTALGVVGCLLLLTSVGVECIHKLQFKYRVHRIWNVILGYIQVMLKQNEGFLMSVSMTTLSMTLLFVFTYDYSTIFFSVLFIIIAMMLMNMLTIQQSIALKLKQHIKRNVLLSSLGYNKTDIMKTVHWEYGLFYFIMYASGYIFCSIGSGLCLYHNMISWGVFLLIIVLQICFGCMGYSITIRAYRRVDAKEIAND